MGRPTFTVAVIYKEPPPQKVRGHNGKEKRQTIDSRERSGDGGGSVGGVGTCAVMTVLVDD